MRGRDGVEVVQRPVGPIGRRERRDYNVTAARADIDVRPDLPDRAGSRPIEVAMKPPAWRLDRVGGAGVSMLSDQRGPTLLAIGGISVHNYEVTAATVYCEAVPGRLPRGNQRLILGGVLKSVGPREGLF